MSNVYCFLSDVQKDTVSGGWKVPSDGAWHKIPFLKYDSHFSGPAGVSWTWQPDLKRYAMVKPPGEYIVPVFVSLSLILFLWTPAHTGYDNYGMRSKWLDHENGILLPEYMFRVSLEETTPYTGEDIIIQKNLSGMYMPGLPAGTGDELILDPDIQPTPGEYYVDEDSFEEKNGFLGYYSRISGQASGVMLVSFEHSNARVMTITSRLKTDVSVVGQDSRVYVHPQSVFTAFPLIEF